uniref:arylesterase n=1 Tax=Rubritepida flocculans TaxID=182403 RepID=UPI0005659024|nr:arylesterase [Rubritepida flocculans]
MHRYGRRAALRKALLLAGGGALPARAAQPQRLLALGDSLTAGYGLPRGQGFVPQLQAALAARGRAVRVLDGGVSGDTMAGGAARLDWALADRPQAALVALGGNDGLRGLPVAQMAAALDSILARLEARRIPTLLAGMHAPPNLGADYGRAFHAIFTEAAARRPGLVFMPFFLEGVAGEPRLNQPDGIHPNAEGVAEMVRRILPFVEQVLDRAAAQAAG